MSLYLGDLPEGITGHDKYFLKILTVAAKKAITCKWLKPDPVDNWLEIVVEIHEMERLTLQLRLINDQYVTRWTKLIKYLLE